MPPTIRLQTKDGQQKGGRHETEMVVRAPVDDETALLFVGDGLLGGADQVVGGALDGVAGLLEALRRRRVRIGLDLAGHQQLGRGTGHLFGRRDHLLLGRVALDQRVGRLDQTVRRRRHQTRRRDQPLRPLAVVRVGLRSPAQLETNEVHVNAPREQKEKSKKERPFTFPVSTSSRWAADAALTSADVAAAIDLAASRIISSNVRFSSVTCASERASAHQKMIHPPTPVSQHEF